MILPPGVSARDFANALRQWERVVGREWVFSSDEDLDLYRDSYSPFWHEPDDPVPSAAVAPDGVEQVQQIVRIANTFKISAVDGFDRKESGIWRLGAAAFGYCGARPEAHEPDSRSG
jgi:hypothetical protein